jgi:hypothetical protein
MVVPTADDDKIAIAMPTKKLFVEILTRDVSVRDAIFDLIDNSIDAYTLNGLSDHRDVRIEIADSKFQITDNCGGISKDKLENEVFRFGVEDLERDKPTLGIYGIGMKRSLFKLGKQIDLITDDGQNHCVLHLEVDKWEEDAKPEDWNIPLKVEQSSLKRGEKPFTSITVRMLRDPVKEKFRQETFINDLVKRIGIVYTEFIQGPISIHLNGRTPEPYLFKAPVNKDFSPARHIETYDEIKIDIICWLQPKQKRRQLELGQRGWNVFFNRRLILINDTSDETGFSNKPGEFPRYHSILNDFVGVVYLDSRNPSVLPVSTAKNGFNTDSKIYQYVLRKMIETGQPIINYLKTKYKEELAELDEIEEATKDGADAAGKEVPVGKLPKKSKFKAPKRKRKEKTVENISYAKPIDIVARVKQRLKVKSNKNVGERTFEYYVTLERLDE